MYDNTIPFYPSEELQVLLTDKDTCRQQDQFGSYGVQDKAFASLEFSLAIEK